MRLDDALHQIAEIRQQMARSHVFRGYRAATTAFTAVMAVVAAAAQHLLTGDNSLAGLWIWLAAAFISLAVVGAEMALRYRRQDASPLARETTLLAVEQFAPCLIAGAMLTYGIVAWAGYSFSLLPAIWCTLFGLGILASRRLLPRGTFIVGAWYLLAGLACVGVRRQVPFSFQMGIAFGGGQLMAAAVLYWMLERSNARS